MYRTEHISKRASCLQQGTKVILQKMWQSISLFVLNTKCYIWGHIQYNILLSTTLHIFKHVVAASCYGYACYGYAIFTDWGVFQDKKAISTGKIQNKNLVQT
jgi:hypothetical protein